MSKITPKNLHYDDTLPPFLQRLGANNTSDGRHEYHVARPKKARTAEDEAEDEPVYFNEESGETLTKSEWEAKEAEKEKAEEVEGEDIGAATLAGKVAEKESIDKEKVAAIGGSKKRKAGKVVGGGEEEEPREEEAKVLKKQMHKSGGKQAEKGHGKTAKKGKKIKLSFGDNE